MPGRKFPLNVTVKAPHGDYPVPIIVTQELFNSAISYKPDDDDLFVVTFPKNGTTWMLYVMLQLYEKSLVKDEESGKDLYATLDFIGAEKTKEYLSPRLIKSHFLFNLVPKNAQTKYIFMARNPKDTVVSYYYHTIGFQLYDYADGKFDDFFEWFMDGKHDFGDYFEMVPTWWEESKKNKNIHFLLFEDFKTNFEGELLKVAEFVGPEKRDKLLANDKEMVKKIAKKSDVKAMQKDKLFDMKIRPKDLPFIRKGIIGDWKNVLNEKQSKVIDKRLKEAGKKFPGFDELWKNYQEHM